MPKEIEDSMKSISVGDIEEQIREVYNFDISTSTIESVANDIIAWQNQPLDPVFLIV